MLQQDNGKAKDPKSIKSTELGSAEVIEEWVKATLQTALSLDPRSYIPNLYWAHRTRPDGRIFGQARSTSVQVGVLRRNALGSALIKFSSAAADADAPTTMVLAGVTVEVGQPTDREGDLKITLVPNDPVLESWLQRLLLQVVDLRQLCIQPGRAAFGLDISIAVLDAAGGNPTDACLLAAVAALGNTVLPSIVLPNSINTANGGGRVYTLTGDERNQFPSSWITMPSKPLILTVLPFSLTMGVIGRTTSSHPTKEEEEWLVDPSKEEEMVCRGTATIVIDGCHLDQILSLDYQGQVSITQSNLALALKMAQGRAKELLPLLSQPTASRSSNSSS